MTFYEIAVGLVGWILVSVGLTAAVSLLAIGIMAVSAHVRLFWWRRSQRRSDRGTI